ncbi:MAG: Hpt domain-containing protein [Eubacteriales bacterium]|nr:Hpt domain-containing protein [Eubacteriales bacterium]
MTLEALKQWGANVEEGMKRCLNNEGFYLSLVGRILPDDRLARLEGALNEKDFTKAFELAHALKGMYGNLSLTPLYAPISEMTELLRAKTDMDYTALLERAKEQFKKLCEL